MAVPLSKVEDLASRIPAEWEEINELALTSLIKECRARLRGGARGEEAAHLHLIVGRALSRLHRFEEVIAENHSGLHFAEWSELWNNVGVAHMRLESYQEALDAFLRATDLEEDAWANVPLTMNVVSALQMLGRLDDATALFEEALDGADLSRLDHLYVLAGAAAAFQRHVQAVHLFARFLKTWLQVPDEGSAPLDFIASVPDEKVDEIVVPPAVRSSIAYVTALVDGLLAPTPAETDGPLADEERAHIMEDFAPLRERATAEVLSRQSDGEA